MPWVSEGDSARWVEDPVAEAAPDPAQSQAIVADWYRTYLGREPDASGLQAYTDAINAGASTESLVSSIVNSGEGQNYIAAQTSQNAPAMNSGAGRNPVTQEPQSGLNTEQVNQLYRRYLGREPDPSGMNTFRGMDMAQAIRTIATSQEFQNKQDTKQAAAGGSGGVNWLIDPNNLQKNAVSWSDYYGMGQYHYADGSTALADPSSPNTAISVTPPYSSYEDPANMRLGYRNYAYAGSSVPDTVAINGVEVPVQKPEYLINTQTGKVFTDPSKGNRTYTILDVTPQNQPGELYKVFDSTIKIGAAIMASAAMGPQMGASILTSMGASAATAAAYGGAVTAAIAAGGNTALNGALNGTDWQKVVEESLKNAAIAGVGAQVAGEISSALPKDIPSSAIGGATGAVKGTVTAILGGKDPISGLARGTISGLTSGAIKDIQTRDINDFDLQGDDQVFDTEEQRYLTPYEVSVKYPELYPEGLPVEERTFGEKLAGTTATTLAGALSSYFFPSTKPSTGSTPTSGRTVTPSTGAKEVPRETSQTTARSPTPPMMATNGTSPATSSYFGPSTAALGQALRVSGESLAPAMAGGGGGDGSTGQEISEESGAAPKKKWVNAQSLRDLDEIGS
jgi:hypothetical protein